MRLSCLSLILASALAGCAAAPTSPVPAAAPANAPAAATAFTETGEIEGAPYRVEAPAGWQGDLVMYLHGYEPVGSPREQAVSQNEFDRQMLAQGFAVARSEYSAQGWAVVEALQDNERLRRHVVARLPATRRTWLVGHSMGGHLALATLERHPDAYDGALALCGANGPAPELFNDGVLPPLVVFDYFFPGVLPLGPGGLADPASAPWPDAEAIEKALASDETRAALLATRYDILRKDLAGGLMIRYAVLHEMARRAGGFPVDNTRAVYTGLGDDAAVNAGVRRYAGHPAAVAYLKASSTLAGTAPKPIVVLSNLNDPTVPARFSGRYAELAEQAGRSDRVTVLPSTGEGHCSFTADDVNRALRVLTATANR